jgi:DNA-binding NarL/FixJ family response regulator
MAFAGHEFTGPVSIGPLGSLPDRVRCLFMTTPRRTGAWLAEALAADSATRVYLEEASSPSEGLARLGEQVFDAVLISHEPGQLDALEIVEGLRAGGNEEPLIVLGAASEAEMSPLSFEVGADAYVCVSTATTRGLLWLVARAIEHRQLLRENRRLRQAEQHRLQHEQREAEHLLGEQRILVKTWDEYSVSGADDFRPADRAAEGHAFNSQSVSRLPEPLTNHYRDLLRAHVIMGSGNLRRDIAQLADLLIQAEVTAPAALQLHTDALSELIRGLGNRSARHVMTRADMMALELSLRLSEGYRLRRDAPALEPHQRSPSRSDSSRSGPSHSGIAPGEAFRG